MRYFLYDGEQRRDNHQPRYRIECDVLVIGTNETGCIAAVSAAKSGCKVIAADSAKLPLQCGYSNRTESYDSFGQKVIDSMDKSESERIIDGNADLDLQECKNSIERMLKIRNLFMKYGISFLADSTPHSVYMNGGALEGVSFITADGMFDIKCKRIIDTTGIISHIVDKSYNDTSDGQDKFEYSRKIIKMMSE